MCASLVEITKDVRVPASVHYAGSARLYSLLASII